jgi:hypothetical protein
LPVDLRELDSLYRRFNKAISSPTIPSDSDKRQLEQVEALKVGDPLDAIYLAAERQPETSGARPERMVVEVRTRRTFTAITYWYYWSHDRFSGDHPDWEL